MSDEDAAAIRQVVERVFHALDSRELHLLETVFAPEARFSLEGGARVIDGREAILMTMGGPRPFSASTHWIANHRAEIDGDKAKARTFAVAVLVEADGGRTRMRGLEYDDHFVRATDGWRIALRQHKANWQIDGAAVNVKL